MDCSVSWRLLSGEAETAGNAERRNLMKEVDPEAAKRNALEPPYDPRIGRTLTIDTTRMTASEVAGKILAHIAEA